MFGKLWKKCVNYETISYLICGVLTTVVDFASYTVFRKMSMGVGTSQALSWVAAVLFAYIVNKIIVFRNFNMHPGYLLKEGSAFFCSKGLHFHQPLLCRQPGIGNGITVPGGRFIPEGQPRIVVRRAYQPIKIDFSS